VDQADLVRKDVQAVSPQTAQQIKQAQDKMQETRLALTQSDRNKAAERSAEALQALETAHQQVRQELARAEARQDLPRDLAAALESLADQVRQLIADQEALKRKTDPLAKNGDGLKAEAPTQAALELRTRDVQAQAATRASEAAMALGEGAQHMHQAQ